MVSPSPVRPKPKLETAPAASIPWFGIFICLTVIIYCVTTGTLPLLGRDEPRYVEVAREMWASGDWVTPRLGGMTWFEKPALLYWMVAASFSVFGASEWAARLGPTACGITILFLLYWIALPSGRSIARWAAASVATSVGIMAFSFAATFDIVLTATVTLAIAAFGVSLECPQDQRNRYLALFWVGVGLAFLAKGLVAYILTLGTVLLYALIRRERVQVGLIWGVALSLVVGAIWYAPVTLQNGETFLNEFFVQHHFQRYLSDKYKHHQEAYFYFEILPLLALPWTPFLIGAFAQLRKVSLREDSPTARLRALGLAWTMVPVLFFSLSGSKLPGYILPAIPGLFLFAAPFLASWSITPGRRFTCAALAGLMLLVRPAVCLVGPSLSGLPENHIRALLDSPAAHDHRDLSLVEYRVTERLSQYYAAGQLVYDPATRDILSIESPQELASLARHAPLLVLVKQDHVEELRASPLLEVKLVLAEGKFELLRVRQKE